MSENVGSKITGVILAAGEGSRLRPLSFEQPKPMLPICNKPIIQHQIEYMRSIGIKRFLIVVGHLGRHIMEAFGNGEVLGVQIRYVFQDKPLGIAHAVYQLEDEVDQPFLLFLGDIFLVPESLGRMVELFYQQEAAAVIAVKKESDPEYVKRNFAVHLSPDGRIVKVIEKPRYVKNNLKGCGIYLFDMPVFDAIRRTPRTAMRDEYEITTSIQILIDDGIPVYPAEVVQWDMNVTIPCDLLECNLRYLKSLGKPFLVGDWTIVPEGLHLIDTVIGDNVRITHPIRLTHSLVTSGAVITSNHDLDQVIITRDNIIQCSLPFYTDTDPAHDI